MPTMDESGFCTRAEYDEAFAVRKKEAQLELGEVGVLYLAVENHKEIAIKQAVRIKRIGKGVVNVAEIIVDIELLDEDMQPVGEVPGGMKDGVWNNIDERGNLQHIVIKTPKGAELVTGNGCLTNYSDGFDGELKALMDQELLLASS